MSENYRSQFTIMNSNLQKQYVTRVEGVKPNVESICTFILASAPCKPATSDNLLLVYPQAKHIRKTGCCKILKNAPPKKDLLARRLRKEVPVKTEHTTKPVNSRPSGESILAHERSSAKHDLNKLSKSIALSAQP